MINNNASVALSLDSICRFLHDQAGIIVLNHQMDNLARFLETNPALAHASNFQQYLKQLQSSEYSQEFMDLIAAVTVGESYFFRWSAQMEFLQTVCLP